MEGYVFVSVMAYIQYSCNIDDLNVYMCKLLFCIFCVFLIYIFIHMNI